MEHSGTVMMYQEVGSVGHKQERACWQGRQGLWPGLGGWGRLSGRDAKGVCGQGLDILGKCRGLSGAARAKALRQGRAWVSGSSDRTWAAGRRSLCTGGGHHASCKVISQRMREEEHPT